MRRTILACAALALMLPTAALAKGASKAEVTGPALDEAIVITGTEEPDSPLQALALQAGFYPSVFRQTPDPMLAGRPAGRLGPKYRITWTMPGPNNETDLIRQDVYPYAKGGPVTYTEPGQKFFTTERTRGGWYRSTVELKRRLVAAGLPGSASSTGSNGRDWTVPVGLGAAAAALLALLAAGIVLRRRTHPATA